MNDTLQPAMTMGRRFLNVLPTVALVGVTLAVGLALSALLARAVRWFTRRSGLEALAERLGTARLLYAVGLQEGIAVQLGRLAFIAGALFTLLTAAEMAGLSTVADALTGVVAYVPRALIAFALLVAGLRLADTARAIVLRASKRQGVFDAPEVVGTIVYYAVLILAVALVSDQLGLETDLLNGIIQIVVAAAAVGLALSLALGARGVLGHVVARIYVSRMVRPGDRVRVSSPSGPLDAEVVRYGPALMLVRDGEGREHLVPCGRLLDEVVGIVRVEGSRVDPGHPAAPTGDEPLAAPPTQSVPPTE